MPSRVIAVPAQALTDAGISAIATPKPRSERLPGLELLRLVAAVCVLLLHTRGVFGGKPVFARGYIGVDYFLMLSGFLMAGRQETRLAQGDSPWRFLWRRYLRMWPMMVVGGIIGLPMEHVRSHGGVTFLGVALANLMLLPAWGAPFVFPLNIPAWTVFAELMANACHVLALWRVRGRWIWALAFSLGVALVALVIAFGTINLGPKPDNFGAGLVRCLFAYVLGIGLGRGWGAKPPLPIPPALAIVAMPAWLVTGWALGWRGWWPDMTFVMVICPLMLWGGLRMRALPRTAAWAGRLAFPLFALQMPVLEGLRYRGYGQGFSASCAVVVGLLGMAIEPVLDRLTQPRGDRM